MAEQRIYFDLNEFQATRAKRRWWLKAIPTCAILGGIYGAAVGAAIGAVPGAADIIGLAAAVMAVLCGVPGARYGFFFGMVNRVRFGRSFVGAVTAIGGAILGAFMATMILLALGAILGAVCGWVMARALLALRHGILRRFLVGIVGAVVGMQLGAILWAIRLNESAALTGAAWGLGIGVVVGPLLMLLFIGTLNSLPHIRSRGGYLDTTFHREDQGGQP
jgi:hypothetical protein